ncbi:hypothetical protein PoB_007602000 [Plakobranchus ocellatus]|uniref:HTH psq-type domain-containing protein n=1 Tax=Plakobranchus ocellatus TaxID=259542 RepID=A0AAV4DZM0_9GAST|nr:hypothetical protein PoB_007602000 [Plakobranchus ocellatus]
MHEAFENALDAATNGSMKLMNAAKQFGVPRATLFDNLHNRTPDLPRPVFLFCDGHTSHANLQNGDAPKSQLIVAIASETTSKSNGPGPSGDGVFSDKMDAIATSQYIEKDLEPKIHDDVSGQEVGAHASGMKNVLSTEDTPLPRHEFCFSDPGASSKQTSMEITLTYEDAPDTSLDHTYNRTKHTATESFQPPQKMALLLDKYTDFIISRGWTMSDLYLISYKTPAIRKWAT